MAKTEAEVRNAATKVKATQAKQMDCQIDEITFTFFQIKMPKNTLTFQKKQS